MHTPLRFLLLLSALSLGALLSGCSTGTHILTGPARPPIDEDQVVVYSVPPAHYTVVGVVTAEAKGGWSKQGQMDSAVEELKAEAAKIGANGVILEGTGTSSRGGVVSGGLYMPESHPTVTGTAIWVGP